MDGYVEAKIKGKKRWWFICEIDKKWKCQKDCSGKKDCSNKDSFGQKKSLRIKTTTIRWN